MLKLYNSLTRKKEPFEIPAEKTIKMYTCGATVYYFPHIGNMRAYLFMDELRRTLKYNGYKLNGVINLTDVGHLTSDADEGDDKMEIASKKENRSPYEIAKFYTEKFFEDIAKLNIDIPEHIAKATDHIQEMIEFNKALEKKGFTYLLEDGLYFDVQKFKSYGALSGKDLNSEKIARIEENKDKHHPFDFALWKFVSSNHIMKWESPWGTGCPGWHIECSAMGQKYLGDEIDIHTGGVDHLSIHHENEIAQNNAKCGKEVVKRWMHVEFLQVDGGKMSKSLGNLYTISQLEEMGYSPLDFKYFNFLTHYRKKINFTFDALKSASQARKSLIEQLKLHKISQRELTYAEKEKWQQEFKDAINDDLNFPLAIGIIWKLIKEEKSSDIYEMIIQMDKALGLKLEEDISIDSKIPEEIKTLADQRWQAKQNKDFKKSDELRIKLDELGYIVKDSKDTFTISKK